jgi:peptide/histidine transporter 3/4
VGLGVLAGVLAMALALFLFGIKRYRKEGPTGSPFTRLAQVIVASFRKWHMQETLLHSNNFCYSEEEKLEPHHHHVHVQPKYHTLLHTLQYRWVTLFPFS